MTLLQNDHPHPEFEKEIYIENLLHYYRSAEILENEVTLDYSDFERRHSGPRGGHRFDFNLQHCVICHWKGIDLVILKMLSIK